MSGTELVQIIAERVPHPTKTRREIDMVTLSDDMGVKPLFANNTLRHGGLPFSEKVKKLKLYTV